MRKNKKAGILLGMGAMALMVYGCGGKKIVKTEAPAQPPAQETAKVEQAQVPALEKYQVRKGDTLWAIAFQKRIYAESAFWPLVFKSNQDRIKDPDLLTPGQILLIQKGQTDAQLDKARQLAKDTPAYISHQFPRDPLPLNYF